MPRKVLFTWTQCREVLYSIYPLQGIIKLDFLTFTSWHLKLFEPFQNAQKWPVFIPLKILSFLKDIVSPINLINPIIINYQLSIERNALESTVIIFFFFTRHPKLSLEICWQRARPRALSAGLLLSDMYARVKSSLCLSPFPCKQLCRTETIIIISF